LALKTIDQNPSITDTVVFDILTPDANGCFGANPYMVNNVILYYVQRDFALGNPTEYEKVAYDKTQEAAVDNAIAVACQTPTPDNIALAKQAQLQAESHATVSPVYFNEALTVDVVGNPAYPAWLSTDIGNAFITNIPTDDQGNPQYGHFQFTWEPLGMREGDYFICWTWTLLPAGDSLSAHTPFTLKGDTQQTTSIPTHQTDPIKYPTLLDRYLPEMFKMTLCPGDLSTQVLHQFNLAVAQGFTDLENLYNQIVDLLDANALAEAFLPLLARLFNLKLKSHDPTRWRRQIKTAIPLFKAKGTVPAMEEAFQQAGMNMTKLTRMWQVVSFYTWQDQFDYLGSNDFILSHTALPSDTTNFALSIRHAEDTGYTATSYTNVSFTTDGGITTMTWTGPALQPGDSLLVLYLINPVPDANSQLIENYIRTLPLADQRDERDQGYPLKNWNVRMIEEDDPMFGVVIPNRYPYQEALVFGKIRTEFPYSENTYLMDEYNGSLRDSLEPCDIDKDFLDPCGQCQGSKFSIDLEIQDLSNDRLVEAQDIIRDFSPFHAVLHSINFSGGVDEFMQPPVETIECLVQYTGREEVVAGGAQYIFSRAMFGGFDVAQIKRNVLANAVLVVNNAGGTAYNDNIVIACPQVNFSEIGMNLEGSNVLEILAPSPLAGKYVLSAPNNNYADIAPTPPTNLTQPVSHAPFTFRLSNNVYTNTTATITQDNYVELKDANVSFAALGVVSEWDIGQGHLGGPWQIKIPAYSATPYVIHQVLPDGGLVLKYATSLPTSNASNLTYQLLTDQNVVMANSTTGSIVVTKRALVDISSDPLMNDLSTITEPGEWMLDSTGSQYQIADLVTTASGSVMLTQKFHIWGWTLGNVGSRTIHIYNRLVDNQVGYLGYIGQELHAGTNLETSLGINNGANPPAVTLEDSHFKENFLVVIGSDYYSIAAINGAQLTLIGTQYDWKTLAAGGTPVTFNVYRYIRQPYTIQGMKFDQIDRRGKEIITNDLDQTQVLAAAPPEFLFAQMNKPATEVVEPVEQSESIKYTIEYADGTKEKGEI